MNANPFATPNSPAAAAPAASSAPAQTGPAEDFVNAGDAAPAGDPFADPAGPGSGEKITDYAGHLLLVTPTEYVENMSTSIGETDVVRADVVVLDGDNPGHSIPDMLVFQTALKRDLTRVLQGPGKMMLGRLGQGEAKKGKSAPWIFIPGTEEDKTLARQYLTARG